MDFNSILEELKEEVEPKEQIAPADAEPENKDKSEASDNEAPVYMSESEADAEVASFADEDGGPADEDELPEEDNYWINLIK